MTGSKQGGKIIFMREIKQFPIHENYNKRNRCVQCECTHNL